VKVRLALGLSQTSDYFDRWRTYGESLDVHLQRRVHYRGTIYVYASLGRYPKEEDEAVEAEVGFTITPEAVLGRECESLR
jgi:hypothetical protein